MALSVLSGLAFLSLAVYCVLSAVAITAAGAKLLPNQTDNTYPESTNIYAAIDAARTGHLYEVPSLPPYVFQPFGPLYYAINATIARESHLNFGTGEGSHSAADLWLLYLKRGNYFSNPAESFGSRW